MAEEDESRVEDESRAEDEERAEHESRGGGESNTFEFIAPKQIPEIAEQFSVSVILTILSTPPYLPLLC